MAELRNNVKSPQPLPRVLGLRIDGSEVATSAGVAGLDEGAKDVTISKGSGGTSNEVTIAFNTAFAAAPVVSATVITDDCHVRIKSVSASQVVLETVQNDANGTGVDDADMHVMILGHDSATRY